ncbi:MAG: permease [Dactylosporangium sp.]|nr:permease [Dactylosporangium sp.]
MQTVLLILGGLLLAGAAVVLTVIAFSSIGAVGRITFLALITAVALALPIQLARRNLRATAETIAAVALLLVLLDGYVAWSLRLFGGTAVPTPAFFGLVCLITAAVSAGYHATSHLVAPRFAALLVLQPVIPLLGYPLIEGPTGWALALAGVAAIDLGFGASWLRIPTPARAAGGGVPALVLRDFAWLLFAIAYAAGMVSASVALLPADSPEAALVAAGVLVLIAALGVAGGIVWRREPVPAVAGGLATIAIVLAATRLGTIAMPGHTLLFAASGVLLVALIVPALPAYARRGPMVAGAVAAAGTALLQLIAAIPAITAPLRAITPVWNAGLDSYPDRVAALAGSGSWQLVTAGVMLTAAAAIILPTEARPDGVVIGATLTLLSTPAALSLSWIVTPAVAVAAAVAIMVVALNIARARTAWICLASSIVFACYAAATSLSRPSATTLILTAIVIAGASIAFSPRVARDDPDTERVVRRVSDVAGAGALLALPGAAAAGAATVLPGPSTDRIPMVLVASFLALAASIGAAALAQFSRREQSPPLLVGASIATLAVVTAAFVLPGAGALDMLVGFLMASAVALLWLSPIIDERQTSSSEFGGTDVATAALTVATIGAVLRASALLAPGVELLSIAVLVLVIAVAIQILPEPWRRGPVAGGSLVGFSVAAFASVFAIAGTIGVLRAAMPLWKAPTGRVWQQTASEYLDFGAQIPLTLLLLAAAGAVALPRHFNDAAAASALALGAASAPVGFALGWTSPLLIGCATATGLGIAAVFAGSRRAAYVRLAVAGGLGVETIVASLARPGATAGTLLSLAISGMLIAGLGMTVGRLRRDRDRQATAHLPVAGGFGMATALLLLPGAIAAMLAAAHRSPTVVATAALATTTVGLVLAGLACQRHRAYLPFVTGGVAAAGLMIIIISIPTPLPTSVYAAGAALLGVLAELLRAGGGDGSGDDSPRAPFLPGGQHGRPRGERGPAPEGRQPVTSGGFGFGVAIAAGVPAAIAIITITPAVVAALLGPYRWIAAPWEGTVRTGAGLGWFDTWTSSASEVLAAFVLAVAATLVAIGLGGRPTIVANRAISVIIPGAAVTLLITPGAFDAAYPAQPAAALVVATLAGLGVALTPPPPAPMRSPSLLFGRRLAVAIAFLAAGAGVSGSLATPTQTIVTLAASIVVGLIGALGGRTPLARLVAWQVAAGSAVLLALAAGFALDLDTARCAYPVLMVSAVLLGFAGLLPKYRSTPSIDREITMIEAVGFLGAISSVTLTIGSAADAAAVCFALGAVLGLAAARPQRGASPRMVLILGAAFAELVAVWLLLVSVDTVLPEAYTLPFAALALLVGLVDLRRRPDTGSAIAYGPALVAGFAPTLFIVLSTDASSARRVLLIAVAVLTVAIGSWFRQKAPVVIGAIVTAIATLHELVLLGRFLPWPVLLGLFTAAGVLLIGLGASYEQRRQNVQRIRGVLGRMR